MKKLNLFLLAVLGVTTLHAAKIEQVIVRQQWPWSTDVKVEYKLSAVTNPVDITLQAFNGATELALPVEAVTGDRYGIAEDGVGTLVIDPVMAFGTEKVALANFKVKLTVSDSDEHINDVVYKIFDLDTGACEDVMTKDLLNGSFGEEGTDRSIVRDFAQIGSGFTTSLSDVLIWTGVTNGTLYKTSKLVMRRIPAKDVVWQCGSTGDQAGNTTKNPPQRYIKLSHDYFIGVFELTQAQYKKLMNANPSEFKSEDDWEVRPAESFGYHQLRGNPVNVSSNAKGMLTGESVNWPTNSYLRDVASATVCGNARAKFGWEFDLPTEAEWEFACRAGTTNKFNSGKGELQSVAQELAWTYVDSPTSTQAVGLKKPNAFGLYDMHGNVMEMAVNGGACYEGGTGGEGLEENDPIVDPVGKTDVTNYDAVNRIKRGGSYGSNQPTTTNIEISWADCASARRCAWYVWYQVRSDMGARLVCPVNAQWAPHN